ncbi:CvpA family protein [Aminipila luticellarii]|uniref:CvpA family protein n=1 Tax=Aminipila luticellarii TaxID=2507160 RepID=A0A410PSG2_9FIRM|nr:CvpA family protein [Aminipila luticellarii]QAT41853.1 CvpA family protein [Aminipila luticellarii]
MILDMFIAAVVIGTMVRGYRHGLLRSFIHTIGWFAALGAAFIWSPQFNTFILDHTGLYPAIYGNINEKVSTTISPAEMQGSMPTIIQTPLTNMIHSLSDSVSTGLSNLFFTIVCFLAVVFAVQAFLHVLISLLSKEHNDGITGFFDGCMGMLFGFIKGIVYTFILLALMLPAATLIHPNVLPLLIENLGRSHFALELYNNNLILLIVKDLL